MKNQQVILAEGRSCLRQLQPDQVAVGLVQLSVKISSRMEIPQPLRALFPVPDDHDGGNFLPYI